MQTRQIAASIIQKVIQGASLSDVLPAHLAKIKIPQDAAFIQSLCYGTCRWYFELKHVLDTLLTTPLKNKDCDIQSLLLLGLYQLLHSQVSPHAAVAETVAAIPRHKSWAKGLVNAILRRSLREMPFSPHHAHPEWWAKAIYTAWPNDAEPLMMSNNQHPPLMLRVNQLKCSREHYLNILDQAGIEAYPIEETLMGIRLENPVPVTQLPHFAAGYVSVQDAAAQLAAELLSPQQGERILDACAAPGGKTTHLLEYQPEMLELVAIDHHAARVNKIKDNLTRLNLACTLIEADAGDPTTWWDGVLFDRILLDAPCSASGVVRRHPDIRMLRREEDIPALAVEQLRLLNALWPLLKPNGVLLYVTCSIFPTENSAVIRQFLNQHADAREKVIQATFGRTCEVGRQILPHEHQMDGFYYAALQK